MSTIIGSKDCDMSDEEFLGFVQVMSRELAAIAQERGMIALMPGLEAVIAGSLALSSLTNLRTFFPNEHSTGTRKKKQQVG